jgi:hypothetical protein
MTTPPPRKRPAHPPRVNIRVVREREAITVAQLRDRIAEFGVERTEGHLRGVELGQQNLSPELRAAWARALGIKFSDVIVPENGNEEHHN